MIINNKRIWPGLFIGIVMSFSVYGQNINAEKITVPDSKPSQVRSLLIII